MNTLRSEWIKLSTLTVIKVLLAVAVAFPIVVTALTTILGDGIRNSEDLADLISGLMLLSSLLFGVVAAIGMTNEFNYNTIRPTFAAQPVRIKQLLGKLTVHLGVTVVLTTLVLGASWIGGSVIVGDEGQFPFWDTFGIPIKEAMLGTGLLAVWLTMLGFGLGLLIRNTPATVSFLLLWPLLGESIIRGLFSALDHEEWAKYLPYFEGLNMGFVDRGDDTDVMSRFNGGAYFFTWVILITIFGLIRTERSDA